jgi:hypothetical protein
MALPQLNDIPKYETIIPSTQKSVRFRPFLVKEQKVLLMALESQNERSIVNAITDTLKSCIVDPIKLNSLTTFDVEYLFTQIRSKAVGESTDIGLKCTSCEHVNEIKVNLEKIKIDVPKKIPSIKINDTYTLNMKYPSYAQAIELEMDNGAATYTEQVYNSIITSLDSLQTEDEIIKFDEEPKEEVEKFLEQLTTPQFDKLMEFVQALPKLKHDIEFKCEKCKHENKVVLQGINDFFK